MVRLDALGFHLVQAVGLRYSLLRRRRSRIIALSGSVLPWAMLTSILPGLVARPLRSDPIGIYHWGGRYTTSVSEGVERIASLGGRIARFSLSPRYGRDYNVATGCDTEFSLAKAAQQPDIYRALQIHEIDVFIITAYDGVSWRDCEHANFLNPAFYTPENTLALVQEYSDFAVYLYRTYRDTHKRFIISNWESDNSIYCGDAYAFATSDAFRTQCLSEYRMYSGASSPDEAMGALKRWFQARAQGIIDGRNRALAEGIGGMRVYIAPEFNIVHALHDRGLKSILYDVLPSVMFDYVSYSSWESINSEEPANTLNADLTIIRDVVGSTAIIIGEMGFSRARGPEVERTSIVITAALEWGVAYTVVWHLYDDDSAPQFGLVGVDGQITRLGLWFATHLAHGDGARGSSTLPR